MKIAFIGQKGIPASWGGVEEHVEQLSVRLAARGHNVTVYSRNWYSENRGGLYNKVNVRSIPSVNTKHLDAITHSLFCSLDTLIGDYDIVHFHSIGPSFFSWLPKLRRRAVIATIHRFDYESEKWNSAASRFLKLSENIALTVPSKTIVVAKHQKEHYEQTGNKVVYIPNGVMRPRKVECDLITDKYGLLGKDYFLSMGRLTPEKKIDLLIESFRRSRINTKLIIAGGSSATQGYVKKLHELAGNDDRIIFTGYVQGQEKEELFSNAKGFIIPSELEGLPIALLEAMSYGLPCIASDIPPHKEVIEERVDGYLFRSGSLESLGEMLIFVNDMPEEDEQRVSENAKKTVRLNYDWDNITDQIEKVYSSVLR